MGKTTINYLPGLDIIKYIMAILIVAAHCDLFEEWLSVIEAFSHVTEIAVPTFFAISAYLTFSKIEKNPEDSKRIFGGTIKRLAIFFVVWYVLMFPYSYIHVLSYANFNQLLYLAVIGCAFLGYWFIKALIVNTAIVFFFRGRKALVIAAVFSSLVYLFFGFDYIYGALGQMLHPYYSFYYHTYAFAFGALIARYQQRLPPFLQNTKNLIMAFVLILGASYVGGFRVVSKLLYPIVLLLLALQYKGSISRDSSKKLRIMSILYYVMQFILIFGYNALFESSNSIVRFLVILLALTLFSEIIIRLEKYPRFSFLKYLH